jgi:hypothetical protein
VPYINEGMETLLDEIKVITIPPDSMTYPFWLHPVQLPQASLAIFSPILASSLVIFRHPGRIYGKWIGSRLWGRWKPRICPTTAAISLKTD